MHGQIDTFRFLRKMKRKIHKHEKQSNIWIQWLATV